MMDFTTILERYQKYSFSERDKGTRFEELMGRFLVTNPLYADDLDQVWLWTEFPFRNDFGGKDIGIDLVAKTKSGDYWAIQCKCYAPSTTISKADVDTFLSTSGKYFTDEMGQQRHFTRRLWIATTDRWSKEANITLQNQEPPVNRLGPYDLRTAPVDWQKLYNGETGSKALAEKKTPRPHQKEAIAKAHAYYKNHDRGKMISACGTGKTYTALKIVEDQTHKDGFALFLVPSIAHTRELHANEIVLLAYYIASINIENAFHDLMQDDGYTSFDGICLTDTFQLGEENSDDRLFSEVFPKNSIRVLEQKHTPIRVIVGNPPLSII